MQINTCTHRSELHTISLSGVDCIKDFKMKSLPMLVIKSFLYMLIHSVLNKYQSISGTNIIVCNMKKRKQNKG